jgi:lipopolysaccharide transport system ATP-binding protein
MSDTIISVENIGKRYSLRHQTGQRYTALRDVIADKAKSFFRRNGKEAEMTREDLWALKNVSFEVARGEVVGIIGRNGAGKSTLLKILSRITEPTEGRVHIKGRVASLLEVGTGFHPELTGRENIFLNGAILGMARAEIQKKFDEIVDFAEIEKFLDTPVKRYSSGMYVRLAFAVAAHLEPEILVVDEVLAVGDAQFQKKCLGKMESVSRREGRTVLFVSHNMAAVEALCSSAMVLASGVMIARGDTLSMVHTYLNQVGRLQAAALIDRVDREGTGVLRFIGTELADGSGKSVASFRCGTDSTLVLHCCNNSSEELRNVRVAIGINTELDQRVLLLDTALLGQDLSTIPRGEGQISIVIPKLCLLPGRYHFTIWASVSRVLADWIKNAGTFDVEGGDYFGTGQLPPHGQGFFVTPHVFLYEPKASAKKTEEPAGLS